MTERFARFLEGRWSPADGPVIVAEVSANHGQSLEHARKIVELAASSGADAIKLQTYTPEMMVPENRGETEKVEGWSDPWNGRSMYQLYADAQTPWEWHEELFDLAHRLGLGFFSSPFGGEAVDFLEGLGCPAYKIASYENNYSELISQCARTGKPVVISSGASNLAEIQYAIAVAQEAGCERVSILHCTSAYPAPVEESNISTIPKLAELLGVPVGLSDHTTGIGAAVGASVLGAFMIEKHFMLDEDQLVTPDSHFSTTARTFHFMTSAIREAVAAIGQPTFEPTRSEIPSVAEKRSLFFSSDLHAGHVLEKRDLVSRRPRIGLEPREIVGLIGKVLSSDVSAGDPVRLDLM